MKISVITIVHNNKECIVDCIESVMSQTYPHIEHIIIDGGSVDGTQQAILPFRDRIAGYVSEKDSGLYSALNKGIRMATGDIVGVLHSDDLYYNNNTLQSIAQSFLDSKADLVYANGQYVDKADTSKVKRIYRSMPFRKIFLYFGWIPLHTTIYVKRDVFFKHGLYDEAYSIAGDYDISLRWFFNKSITKHHLNMWVVKMRLGGKSTSACLQRKKSLEDYNIIRKYKLCGVFTLMCKVGRKVPQYIIPRLGLLKL